MSAENRKHYRLRTEKRSASGSLPAYATHTAGARCFSTGSTYVLVDCCNDRDALEHIHKKLDKDMEAVDQASCKIDNRLQVLQRFSRYRRKRR